MQISPVVSLTPIINPLTMNQHPPNTYDLNDVQSKFEFFPTIQAHIFQIP